MVHGDVEDTETSTARERTLRKRGGKGPTSGGPVFSDGIHVTRRNDPCRIVAIKTLRRKVTDCRYCSPGLESTDRVTDTVITVVIRSTMVVVVITENDPYTVHDPEKV